MWITITEKCDNVDKEGVKMNMDRIVKITPMRNMGCLLTTESGKDIMVKELLPHFDVLENETIKPFNVVPPPEHLIQQETKVSDDELMAKISEVIKRSLRGPNSEINKRLRTTVKEILEEIPTTIIPLTTPTVAPQVHHKVIANSTKNIMG